MVFDKHIEVCNHHHYHQDLEKCIVRVVGRFMIKGMDFLLWYRQA